MSRVLAHLLSVSPLDRLSLQEDRSLWLNTKFAYKISVKLYFSLASQLEQTGARQHPQMVPLLPVGCSSQATMGAASPSSSGPARPKSAGCGARAEGWMGRWGLCESLLCRENGLDGLLGLGGCGWLLQTSDGVRVRSCRGVPGLCCFMLCHCPAVGAQRRSEHAALGKKETPEAFLSL